jgi:lipopolysaccharide export system permease protein
LKILDLFIIKKFLGTFFFSIAIIISIAIIFDISEKLDDFLSNNAPFKAIVFEYYLNFIPYFVNLFSPLFTFIAVIFFTSKMAYDTEVVAILSSGVSFNRFTLPYIISAAVLTILSLLLLNFVIPKANEGRLNFEEKYIRNKFRNREINIHKQIEPGTYVYFESFNNIENVGYKFSLEKIKDNRIYYKINAEQMRWDTIKNTWVLEYFNIRNILPNNKETLETGSKKDYNLKLDHKEFARRLNNIETMNYFELDNHIKDQQLKGSSDLPFLLVEKYQRVSLPFATFVLTIIGVAISSRKVRGGIGIQIGLGILLSFSYILFMQVSNTFATVGNAPPLLAVWIPNILYSVIAGVLYFKAPK